ncbi:MAG: hypothetical protein MSK39_09270 [Dysosmobacter sp.]|nr:hypothetical protein [Dysosmobacter sp.]
MGLDRVHLSFRGIKKNAPDEKILIKDGKYKTAVPPCFTAVTARSAEYQHTPGRITSAFDVASYWRNSAFAAPSVTHCDHLHLGPAPSTPDSLCAHNGLYLHLGGLEIFDCPYHRLIQIKSQGKNNFGISFLYKQFLPI